MWELLLTDISLRGFMIIILILDSLPSALGIWNNYLAIKVQGADSDES